MWVPAQELERSLDCEHIAPDSAQALRKVYTAMHEMEPEGGRYIAQWARILMRPNLRHIEQACDSLEQSVMGDSAEATLPPESQIRGVFQVLCGAPYLVCTRPGCSSAAACQGALPPDL